MKETYPIPPQASAAEVGAASVTTADSRTVEVGAEVDTGTRPRVSSAYMRSPRNAEPWRLTNHPPPTAASPRTRRTMSMRLMEPVFKGSGTASQPPDLAWPLSVILSHGQRRW